MLRYIFGAVFFLFLTNLEAQTVQVIIEDCLTGTDRTVKVKYMAVGDFMTSNGTDDWGPQTITLGWNTSCGPATGFPLAGVTVTAGSLPFDDGFGGMGNVNFYTPTQIGAATDPAGVVYSTFTAPAMPDVPLADGDMFIAFTIDVPDAWEGGNPGTPGVADGCIFLEETQFVDAAGDPITTNIVPTVLNNGTGVNVWDGMPATSDLPVELLAFNAKPNNASIDLGWVTASERDAQGFELGRSIDGKDFTKIGWVEANGNSLNTISYDFKDLNVKFGVKYYYQLRMIDVDGTVDYSQILQARLASKNSSLTVFPNPVRSVVNLSIDSPADDETVVRFYDVTGKLVLERVQHIVEGANTLQLDISNLAVGTYKLIIEGNQIREIENVVIMD